MKKDSHESDVVATSFAAKMSPRACDLNPTESIIKAARDLGFIGDCDAHLRLLAELKRVAPIDVEVLLVGETGVGKELYAKFIHACSNRQKGEFVAINCAAIPDALFENELFGHSEGAYTDARRKSEGLVSLAENGSLFLDEVDRLSIPSQVKILRLLQEKEYRVLGDTRLRRANIRIISAMNSSPEQAMREGRLREDLYYRLKVVEKFIPPLRERRDDVELLASSFLAKFCIQYGRQVGFSPAVLRILKAYHWPGNVRQLENLVRSLVCECETDEVPEIMVESLCTQECFQEYVAERISVLTAYPFCEAKRLLIEEFEKQYAEEMLRQSKGNLSKAARLSGKHVRAFRRTANDCGINLDEFRDQKEPDPKESKRLKPR